MGRGCCPVADAELEGYYGERDAVAQAEHGLRASGIGAVAHGMFACTPRRKGRVRVSSQ